MPRTVEERFLSKVNKDGPIPEYAPHLGPCWLWTAALFSSGGYGAFKLSGATVRAHRWAYETEVGPIPEGLELDHLCRVPACVRPSHTEAVSHRVNNLRGLRGALTTHCPQGHPLSGDNLAKERWRKCRTCKNERDRAARKRYHGKGDGPHAVIEVVEYEEES